MDVERQCLNVDRYIHFKPKAPAMSFFPIGVEFDFNYTFVLLKPPEVRWRCCCAVCGRACTWTRVGPFYCCRDLFKSSPTPTKYHHHVGEIGKNDPYPSRGYTHSSTRDWSITRSLYTPFSTNSLVSHLQGRQGKARQGKRRDGTNACRKPCSAS